MACRLQSVYKVCIIETPGSLFELKKMILQWKVFLKVQGEIESKIHIAMNPRTANTSKSRTTKDYGKIPVYYLYLSQGVSEFCHP